MSEIAKNRIYKPLTEEHKNKIREANKGKKRTEEAKSNISKGKKGKLFTEVHKLNLRKSKTKRSQGSNFQIML